MSSHAYAETSSTTMHAGFPTPPKSTLGAPNLFILINLDTPVHLQLRTNAQVYRLQEDEPTLRGSGPFPVHSLLHLQSVSTRQVPIP